MNKYISGVHSTFLMLTTWPWSNKQSVTHPVNIQCNYDVSIEVTSAVCRTLLSVLSKLVSIWWKSFMSPAAMALTVTVMMAVAVWIAIVRVSCTTVAKRKQENIAGVRTSSHGRENRRTRRLLKKIFNFW